MPLPRHPSFFDMVWFTITPLSKQNRATLFIPLACTMRFQKLVAHSPWKRGKNCSTWAHRSQEVSGHWGTELFPWKLKPRWISLVLLQAKSSHKVTSAQLTRAHLIIRASSSHLWALWKTPGCLLLYVCKQEDQGNRWCFPPRFYPQHNVSF